MKINHNIAALVANNNLAKTTNKMSSSLEKLSSGYRINKAADDAAGMAISQKMHTQIRGLERASRNAADGVSFIQTAEGALSETENMLQRMRELSVQSANATNTLQDRQAIQKEIDALKAEVDRVASQTEFNTKKLLDGTCQRQTTSDNPSVRTVLMSDDVALTTYSMEIDTAATQAHVTGSASSAGSFTAATAGNVYVNGIAIEIEAGDTWEDAFTKLRDQCDSLGVDVTCSGTPDTPGEITFSSKKYGSSEKIGIQIENPALAAKMGINNGASGQGVDAHVTLDTSSGFSSTATVTGNGQTVTVSDRNGFQMIFDVTGAAGETADINVLDAGYVSLQIGANEGQTVDVSIPAVNTETLGIDLLNVCTEAGATKAIGDLDLAINQVSSVRAKLGAYQNRMESAIKSLDTTAENLTNALSNIEDVDMAEEMATYTQYNVLSQAGTSMLAQANNRPQQILQLLQG